MNKIYTLILAAITIFASQTKSQILYSNNFATSLGTSSISSGSNGNWVWNSTCNQVNTAGHSAGGVATYSGSSCQFGNGSSTMYGDLTTTSIPIGPSGAVLTFNYFIQNECQNPGNTCTYDVLTLQISNNGGSTWTNIMASNGAPAGLVQTATWTPVTYALNTYSNQTILIRFNFNSLDGIGNAYDGIYVDDIIVTGNCFINMTSLPSNSTVTPIICAGNSLTLTTNAVSNYTWNTGANTASIVVSPTVNSVYSVIGTSSANCNSSASLSVTVNASLPNLTVANTASANSGSCPNSTVILTASGGNTYTWTGGSFPITNGVAFTPTTTSNYTVVTANACGTASSALSISVHPLPTVTGVASQPSVCSGNPVTMTGLGTAISYTWDGGAPNGSNLYFSVTANHTVVGTSALGCTAQAVVPVTVVTTPVNPPIPSPQLICIGSTATISSSGATNYTWTTPNGPLSGPSITVAPLATTNYTLTKSNANCVNTQTVDVYVNQLPNIFSIVTPTLICASNPATLQAAGAQTYTWMAAGPPVFTVSGASPIVSPSITTLYTVTASDGTCVNTSTVLLTTNPNPTINIVATSTSICQGDNVGLTANGAIGYSWTTVGINSNSTSASISETPTSSILYQVTGINNFNCTSGAQQVVVVKATPTLNINTTKPIVCTGAPSNLTVAAVQGVQCTYVWSPNAGSATGNIVTVNPITSTAYTAIGTAPNGCTASVNYPVTVFLPTFAVNNPTSSCQGGTIQLIASGAVTYTWNGNQPFSQISVSPPTATVYFCVATSTIVGASCASTQSVGVSIYSNPTITAVPSRTQICRGEETEITGGGAVSYVWNTGQTGSVVPVNPSTNTTYSVIGTDQNGCHGTTTVQVKTSTCFGIEELSLASRLELSIYPNPNNGVFKVSTKLDAKIQIENSLGQLIATFELNEVNGHFVEVSTLAGGVYFANIQQGDERASEKIVVSK